RQLLGARLADADAVEVGEEIWIRISRDEDRGAAGPREVLEPLELPGRAPLEDVVGGVDDQLSLHVLIRVPGVDVASSSLVRRRRQRAHKRRLLDVRDDLDVLSLV